MSSLLHLLRRLDALKRGARDEPPRGEFAKTSLAKAPHQPSAPVLLKLSDQWRPATVPLGVRLSQSDAERARRRVDGWYVLLVCEAPKPEPMPPTGQTVGVDVGVSNFATLSNGEEIENPRHLKSALENLQRQQRRLSRRRKGSKRRAKQRIKVAKAHSKVSRCRKDFHHKVSRDLVRRFDAITVEDLNIRGMVRNRRLAQAISDVGWGSFFTMTKSKASGVETERYSCERETKNAAEEVITAPLHQTAPWLQNYLMSSRR